MAHNIILWLISIPEFQKIKTELISSCRAAQLYLLLTIKLWRKRTVQLQLGFWSISDVTQKLYQKVLRTHFLITSRNWNFSWDPGRSSVSARLTLSLSLSLWQNTSNRKLMKAFIISAYESPHDLSPYDPPLSTPTLGLF